jgi:hypothetical protein
LWRYASLAGVKSANALADLGVHHDGYFWLAGGMAANAHTLPDFRVQDGDFLESVLAHSVRVLRDKGRIDLDRVAQGGMRARAGAGAAPFRRRETLDRLLQEAQAEVQRLQQQADAPAGQEQSELSPQQRAAQWRHAQERVERIQRALQRMPEPKKEGGTGMGRKRPTAREWRSGECGWAQARQKRLTSRGVRRPSASTLKHATAA